MIVASPLTDACGADPGPLCRTVFSLTSSRGAASLADTALAAPLHILLILATAVVVRHLLFRAIDRITGSGKDSRLAAALRPLGELGEKARLRLLETSPLLAERRRQRAETIASLLAARAPWSCSAPPP